MTVVRMLRGISVKIRHDRLIKLAKDRGVAVEDLAAALTREGIRGGPSAAVRNWMAGRDHPRARQQDITDLSRALGCEVKEIARFTSQVRFHRGSNRKAELLADLVRGKPVDEALNLLAFTTKRAAVNMRKALHAAIADAEQAEADVTRLIVSDARVDQGPHIKRFRPKDRGRAHPILKRTSHITIAVEEKT